MKQVVTVTLFTTVHPLIFMRRVTDVLILRLPATWFIMNTLMEPMKDFTVFTATVLTMVRWMKVMQMHGQLEKLITRLSALEFQTLIRTPTCVVTTSTRKFILRIYKEKFTLTAKSFVVVGMIHD